MITGKNRSAERLAALGFMLAVTFVFTSVVSALHLATADKVRLNSRLYQKRAVMKAAGLPAGQSVSEVENWFAGHVMQRGPNDYSVAVDTGAESVDVRVRSGAGLWGRITAVIGISPSARTLVGVAFIEQNETPGLGARIDEPWFTAQLRGKHGPLRSVPEGTRSADPKEFDAITGATITTRAVITILNNTLAEETGGQAAGATQNSPEPPPTTP